MTAARDPYLDLPLDGIRLIEASAGTGKTFTLATLALRLVIERRLGVGEILAVTFTKAATQELRGRIRERLELAARIAGDDLLAGDGTASAFDPDDPEHALCRVLIERALADEPAASLRRRLQRAAFEIDLAAIFTIDGFCLRVLTEHALEAGQSFAAPELIGSERALYDEVAADLWRAFGADADTAELLQAEWRDGPAGLARDLRALLRADVLRPAAPAEEPDPRPALRHAAEALCTAFAEHADEAYARLDAALAAGVFDGRKARKPSYEKAWNTLFEGIAARDWRRDNTGHLDKLTPQRLRECLKAGRERELPQSPLFVALGDWFVAAEARDRWLERRRVALLHRVRDEARRRLDALKRLRRVHSFDDLIDGVAAALDGPHGETLARKLRAQYAIALVDEFQDTDARQWAIFARVFGAIGCDEGMAPALFLIGDPKQAIYRFRGGDVHTYLDAAARAAEAPKLDRNFRSRPMLLRAVAALYGCAGDDAFVDERICFHAVEAGGRIADDHHLRDGRPAPALTVRDLPRPEGREEWRADEARDLAARACAEAIHTLLRQARAGDALLWREARRACTPVHAGDIAVLVRDHKEAARMQAVLAAAGVPAVAAGKQSLFATFDAHELLCVLEALQQPGDDGRLRAALATVLIGLDAETIARLDDDDAWRAQWQGRALGWRERWLRHGPLALVSDLCARAAPRLLALLDGERRLTNLLQLGEALQEADARALGDAGLVDWLRTRIAEADPEDETQLLRLESDARRVQILTLHKSKGLEFPLVFLPFIGIGRDPTRAMPRWCEMREAGQRVLQLVEDEQTRQWEAREQRAEDARLLYVGLTRARHALWLATGPLYRHAATPVAAMLRDLRVLAGMDGNTIDERGLPPECLPPLPPERAEAPHPARRVRRVPDRDWWVYSFTQLTREAPGDAAERGAEDEPEPSLPIADARFSGSRFGNALHDALERVDFAAWRGWRIAAPAPPNEDAALLTALHGGGYASDDLEEGLALLSDLVGRTLTVALPEGGRLCELPPTERRAEMEFHFALRPTSVDALLALLHAHGVLRDRNAFGARRQIEGLMTGKIDLVYARDGRYYVLDYKSNRLSGYDPAALERAMADSEYTLQALIYTVALHRWLRFRLGADYAYERDFGGVRYLFCRGLDPELPAGPDAPGVHANTPAAALVEALDALFAAGGGTP